MNYTILKMYITKITSSCTYDVYYRSTNVYHDALYYNNFKITHSGIYILVPYARRATKRQHRTNTVFLLLDI